MADPAPVFEFIKWCAIAAGTVGIGVPLAWHYGQSAYRAARTVYDDVYGRWRSWKHDRLTLDHIKTQNQLQDLRTIYPDDRGRLPLLYGEKGILRDPNNLRSFTLDAVLETWPALEQLDWVVKTLIAMQGVKAGNAGKAEQLIEGAKAIPELRKHITLRDLLARYGHRPGYHRLVLGEAVDQESGEYKPVVGDMADMVHVLMSGGSGWGKSTELEAMAKQLVLAGDCDLAFVDYGVNTFGMLAEYGLYPIADTPSMAVALFRMLGQEMERRKQLMQDYPQVKKLSQYNQVTGDNLRPLVCFVDEASSLLDKGKETKDLVTDLARIGRKYALGVVFGGTDFKADTMPTEARSNCGLRMAFHLEEPQLSRSILHSSLAVNLRDKGRAFALLPGQPMVEVQCPIVETWDDLPPVREQIVLRAGAEPAVEELSIDQADDPDLPDVVRVRRLHEAGFSDTAIAGQMWHPNPYYIKKVRGILGRDVVVADRDRNGEETPTTTPKDDNNNRGQLVGGGFCGFCDRIREDTPSSVLFGICPECGAAICSDCANDEGLCPACWE